MLSPAKSTTQEASTASLHFASKQAHASVQSLVRRTLISWKPLVDVLRNPKWPSQSLEGLSRRWRSRRPSETGPSSQASASPSASFLSSTLALTVSNSHLYNIYSPLGHDLITNVRLILGYLINACLILGFLNP